MPLLPSLGRTVGTGIKATRALVRGSVRGGAWATRRVGTARAKGAANEIGMIRLFDLHAISCAGDTLITIGLAGTIFFNVPLGEARGKVALYLLITMVPFALLAPVVGPVLDHFRHGRRYALAATMLGRAFLAYVISDNLFGWGLYPAAFGVLALSRAYGVARSAAVPRLLPEGVGLSQVGARASVYGTFAGAVVAPIGLLAFKFGPQWSLRVAAVIFVVGMVISLRLPPRADSDPPEAVPRPWRTMLRLGRGEDRPISGKLIVATLIGSASLRLLYGFLLLFLAFVIMANQLDTHILGSDIGRQGAVGLIGGALAVGTFLSTAVGTRLRIRRPLALQSAGLTVTAGMAVLCALFYNLAMLALLALITAIFSGIAKLAIDASIQERVPERLRASAFAHSETVLMIAWVVGGGIGIIPLPGRAGVAVAALLAVVAALRAGYSATRLHNERLSGRAGDEETTDADTAATASSSRAAGSGAAGSGAAGSGAAGSGAAGPGSGGPGSGGASRARGGWTGAEPADPWPDAPTVPARAKPNTSAPRSRAPEDGRSRPPGQPAPGQPAPGQPAPGQQAPGQPAAEPRRTSPTKPMPPVDPTRVEEPGGKKWRFGRRKAAPPTAPSAAPGDEARSTTPAPYEPETAPIRPDPTRPDPAMAPPGYHVYRPSSATTNGNGTTPPADDERR